MLVKPMVRSNICLNAHPAGCKQNVLNQIEYVKKETEKRGKSCTGIGYKGAGAPRCVLVLGCSNGYGLASRINAAFGYGASTVGVSFEKSGTATKGGTPGWYNNLAFDQFTEKEGLKSITLNCDAFSHETKQQVIDIAKKEGFVFDLVVYSIASPVRTDPDTGVMYKSVLKPIGKVYSGKTIDAFTNEIKEVSAEPATEEEVANTVKVMGGEDWKLWIHKLNEASILSKDCITVAYSYIGPEVSQAIYRTGTIGKAKEHLEKTARELDSEFGGSGMRAFVSVNKGLVTRASAIIPIIPLYLSTLFKVMKQKGLHEGCIEQMYRLFSQRLYISADRTKLRFLLILKTASALMTTKCAKMFKAKFHVLCRLLQVKTAPNRLTLQATDMTFLPRMDLTLTVWITKSKLISLTKFEDKNESGICYKINTAI